MLPQSSMPSLDLPLTRDESIVAAGFRLWEIAIWYLTIYAIVAIPHK